MNNGVDNCVSQFNISTNGHNTSKGFNKKVFSVREINTRVVDVIILTADTTAIYEPVQKIITNQISTFPIFTELYTI